jgi:hypothetical protein
MHATNLVAPSTFVEPDGGSSPFFVGLGLGQLHDPTALAVVEKQWRPDPNDCNRELAHYRCPHLERLPHGTSYPAVVEHVRTLVSRPPLPGCRLVVDYTRVGTGVVDLFRLEHLPCHILPVSVEAGHAWTGGGEDGLRVAKKEIVTAGLVALESRRLTLRRSMNLVDALVCELDTFRVKITAALNETFEALHDSDSDELVLALCLAVWAAQPVPDPCTGPPVYHSLAEPKRPECGREAQEDLGFDRVADWDPTWWDRRESEWWSCTNFPS